ncbi:MAG: glutamine amidotransferase-related protein, partial [Halanaerobium sp.]
MDYDKILILDFGGQYSQLIARRVREFNVYSIIKPHNISIEEIKEINPAAVIFSGGPDSVTAAGAPGVNQGVFELGIP